MRKRQNFANSREVDRISSLPDCLLHEILSFLNTKYVVQTSVLSKRWRYIWKSIPDLNFDFDSFPFQEHSDRHIYKDKGKSFKKFIRRVLSRRHGENIRKFEYFYDEDDENYKFVKKLIRYAVCHNVQQLFIDVYYVDCLALPDCFSTCKSLNAISITCGNLCGWRPLCLLALKSMYLESCVDYPDAYGEEIISGCPNLESLVLFNYPFEHLSITAPKLSHLKIYSGSYRLMIDSKIVISAPRLTSVEFEGLVPLIDSVENLSCVDKVSISAIPPMHYGSTYYSDKKKRKIAANLIPILYVLRSAKSLTLSVTTMEILSMVPHLLTYEPSLFCNLRHLKLEAERKHTVISMPINVRTHLLKNSPCVETIAMEQPED